MLLNKIDIQFQNTYQDIESQINREALLKCFIDLKLTRPVSFIFMSDEELLEVNKDALGHDYYTDVITFNYDDDEIEYNEVLISADRLKDHTNKYNTTLYTEMHRICIHGMLHLAGYNDQLPQDKQKMTDLENHYLALHCST